MTRIECLTVVCVAGIVNEDIYGTTSEFELIAVLLAEESSLHYVNQLGIRIKIHLHFV